MEFFSVDEIEDGYLICENYQGEVKIMPIQSSLKSIKEGSIVYMDDTGALKVDKKRTQSRKKTIKELRIEAKNNKMQND